MNAIDKYLDGQFFGLNNKYEPDYQLLTWIESTLIGGVQTVDIPLMQSGNVLFIRLEQIAISTDGLGGVVSFRDSRLANNLFSINNNVSYFTVTKFDYLVNNTSVQIVSTSATVLFSIGFSRISTKEKTKK